LPCWSSRGAGGTIALWWQLMVGHLK
jgi:hypothetical protein